MSLAVKAQGTLLKIGDGEEVETFSTIAEVTNISGPSLSADSIEVTSHDSEDGYREFIQGLKDAGEVTMDLNFVPTNATQASLLSIYESGEVTNFQMVFPDTTNTTWGFAGFVTGFEVGMPTDTQLTASSTIKITGKPTLENLIASTGLTTPFFVLSEGDATVLPAKATATTFYTANVINATTSLTVTPTAAAGVIKVNGNTVASGDASGAIDLAVGPNQIVVSVTETGKLTKEYEIIVTRASA